MDLGDFWIHDGHTLDTGTTLQPHGSLVVPRGSTLGGLGRSLIPFAGHLVSLLKPRASKVDAAGNQVDTAKTYQTNLFSMVLDGWRLILKFGEALEGAAGTLDGSWLAG